MTRENFNKMLESKNKNIKTRSIIITIKCNLTTTSTK